jgi:hypothetical protein
LLKFRYRHVSLLSPLVLGGSSWEATSPPPTSRCEGAG